MGDSIFNSVSDTVMMSIGFLFASRVPGRYVIALAVVFEIFTAVAIRDNLTLNVINLIAPPHWAPIEAIHDWQAGAARWRDARHRRTSETQSHPPAAPCY